MLEPRRLPARLAAARVAAELGERVGETVGYSVRFDEAGGPRTRLRFMTEGLFVRRLLADPRLPGVAAVVLDELHERHVATDLALAWLRRLRETTRPELAVVAMSATLDAEPVRAFLAGERRRATTVRSEGRRFEVAVEHLRARRPTTGRSSGRSPRAVRAARSARSPTATCWCFCRAPARSGARRRRSPSCRRRRRCAVLPLHGEMPLDEQARAVPARGAPQDRPVDQRRRVVGHHRRGGRR